MPGDLETGWLRDGARCCGPQARPQGLPGPEQATLPDGVSDALTVREPPRDPAAGDAAAAHCAAPHGPARHLLESPT
jgi:hypothetical protein